MAEYIPDLDALERAYVGAATNGMPILSRTADEERALARTRFRRRIAQVEADAVETAREAAQEAADTYRTAHDKLVLTAREANARADHAEALLREVAALHRAVYYDGVEWCTSCVSADNDGMVAWPCPTASIAARAHGEN